VGKVKIYSIPREKKYAGHFKNDMSIFSDVMKSLSEFGYEFGNIPKECDAAIVMSREYNTLKNLNVFDGSAINNIPSIIDCMYNRKKIFELLEANGINIPPTYEEKGEITANEKCVIKNMHSHGKKADTKILEAGEEYDGPLSNYLVQKYIIGKEITFYGIGDKILIKGGKNKKIERICKNLNKIIGLEIFGGQIILNSSYYVIDINDWPAFDNIPNAGLKIASHIDKLIKKRRL